MKLAIFGRVLRMVSGDLSVADWYYRRGLLATQLEIRGGALCF
jgi:hypothetical protein